MEINDCPFCGSSKVRLVNYDENVFCHRCSAMGPIGNSPEDTVELWNRAGSDHQEKWTQEEVDRAERSGSRFNVFFAGEGDYESLE